MEHIEMMLLVLIELGLIVFGPMLLAEGLIVHVAYEIAFGAMFLFWALILGVLIIAAARRPE